MKIPYSSMETYRIISKMNKRDIIKLSRMTCKDHHHSYLAHMNCAIKDGVLTRVKDGKSFIIQEKVGILDIETFTFNFKADMGIMLTYCIKELDGKIISNKITPSECKLSSDNDKRLMKDLIKDLDGFTRLIGHYSTYFDIPFLRTRAIYYNLDFPIYKSIYSTDTYFILKNKFSLRSKSLRHACNFFGIPSKDHEFDFDHWYRAAKGSKKDIDYVLAHNKEDVISTELLYLKINSYALEGKRSI